MSAGADARGALERTSLPGCAQGGASTSTAGARPRERWGSCVSGTCTVRADALHIIEAGLAGRRRDLAGPLRTYGISREPRREWVQQLPAGD